MHAASDLARWRVGATLLLHRASSAIVLAGTVDALEKNDTLGTIQTDEIKLRQILINLLGNAGKFTRNGKVVLRARRTAQEGGEHVLLSVQDTGIGIPPAAIPTLFRNFNQAHENSIRSAGFRLLGLINDLLELSRLEAGKVELRDEEFQLAAIFDDPVSKSRSAIEAGGNELIVDPPPAGQVVCDRRKLQRVIEGLLSNAAKFTRNGRVTVSVVLSDDSWSVAIRDTGVGIPPAQMANLFESFGRSEDETASKYGDEVRLGLPLAYRYCKLMGGDLAVRSDPGRGTTVTVTMPRRSRGADEPTVDGKELQWQPT